jgi:hypothetical protein
MMKKLLTTTAIVGSILGFASAAQAELKIGGSMQWDFNTQEAPATGTKNTGPDDLGVEHEIDLKNTVDLNNGMTATAHMELVGGEITDSSFMINAGDTSFGVQQDDMDIADNDMTPFVHTNHDDQVAGIGYSSGLGSIHGSQSFAFTQKVADGQIIALYAPNNSAASGDDNDASSINQASAGSGYEIGYNGGIGVDGLKINVGFASKTAADESVSTAEKEEATTFGANYNFGQIAVGFNYVDYTGPLSAGGASDDDKQQLGIGATFAVNDNVSFGIARTTVEFDDTDLTADEETTSISVGYNLGPVTFGATHYQLENDGGSTGTDADGLHLTTSISF